MDPGVALLLAGAGVAAGIVTALVGGASLISFPALLAAGLPPVVANASNTVAMSPGSILAAYADVERLPRWSVAFVALLLVGVIGAVLGAILLLALPDRTFAILVPVLIGGATLLFACSKRVSARLARSAEADGRPRGLIVPLALFVPVSVYGGYFGAGMSVMMLAIFAAGGLGDYRAVNSMKNLLGGLTGLVSTVVFISQGMVAWPEMLVMMVGGLIGGYAGGRLARHISTRIARALVIGVGGILTLVSAWKYWLA